MPDLHPLDAIGNWLKQPRLLMKSMVLLAMCIGFMVFMLTQIATAPKAGETLPLIEAESLPELQPAASEELKMDDTCSAVADRNVRALREQGYMATKVIVKNVGGGSHALTGVMVLFDTDGHQLTPEEFDAYYTFNYRTTVDGKLWGVYENTVPDDWSYEHFDCECWRKL